MAVPAFPGTRTPPLSPLFLTKVMTRPPVQHIFVQAFSAWQGQPKKPVRLRRYFFSLSFAFYFLSFLFDFFFALLPHTAKPGLQQRQVKGCHWPIASGLMTSSLYSWYL